MDETRFGPYILKRRIGSGGMGVTYLAIKQGVEGFEKKVAIKKLHPHCTEEEQLIRTLISEAKIAVLLDHPNIVSIYDLNQVDGEFFIAMEYVSGTNLSALLKWNRRPAPEVLLYIVMQVLQGLEYAHNLTTPEGVALNLVHRDVSPDNILIGFNGTVKLTDFGVAKARSQLSRTAVGTIKGKLRYMSPEQALGLQVDSRSDLFAMGVVLYEGLAGRRMYQGDNEAQILRMAQQVGFQPIRKFVPDIEPKLEEIVNRALHREPNQRFQTAAEFYSAISNFILPLTVNDLRQSTQKALATMTGGMEPVSDSKSNISSLSIAQAKAPLVYILPQDLVFNDSLRAALNDPWGAGKRYTFEFLDSSEQTDEAWRKIEAAEQIPYAIIFSGLHVAMEHVLLKNLQPHIEIAKVLIMDHDNGEILSLAANLIGLSAFITTPLQVESLLETLDRCGGVSSLKERVLSVQRHLDMLKKCEGEMKSQMTALAQANIRAVELVAEIEAKNKVIEQKNRMLERMARQMVKPTEQKVAAVTGPGRPASKSVYMQGDLAELTIVDLLQLLAMSRKSALVTLTRGSSVSRVTFQDGQMVDAVLGDYRGEEAVKLLLSWKDGNFVVHALEGPVRRTITHTTEQLLLDILRRMDEQQARGE